MILVVAEVVCSVCVICAAGEEGMNERTMREISGLIKSFSLSKPLHAARALMR